MLGREGFIRLCSGGITGLACGLLCLTFNSVFRYIQLALKRVLIIQICFSKPRPRVKTRGIGALWIYSIHPRDKSRGFLRGGVNSMTQPGRIGICSYIPGRNDSKGPRPFL